MARTVKPPDSDGHQQQLALLSILLYTIDHFFGGVSFLSAPVSDPRHPKRITYPVSCLLFAGMLIFLYRLRSRRQVKFLLQQGPSAQSLLTLFQVPACPHGDTLDHVFSHLDPDQLQNVVATSVATLIRQKVLTAYRLQDRYYVIGIDGTGTLSFSQRHCDHCLTRTANGTTRYYHNVLEAKLLTCRGLVLSLMTEFIENQGENTAKQDCELKAFYRLAYRIKKRFPRLPILLTLDGLFANGPVFGLCQENEWKFMIVLKDGGLPFVNQEFDGLCQLEEHKHLTCWGNGTRQDFRWVDDIAYKDSSHGEHRLSVIECLETKPSPRTATERTTRFKWVTNCKVRTGNVYELANNGGRIRWKLENEGFNTQKNGGYGLEHAYTHNPISAKVFYYLLQLAHMMSQLMEKGSLLRQTFPSGFGSAKNLAFRLLEAWRNTALTTAAMDAIHHWRFQIRFSADTS